MNRTQYLAAAVLLVTAANAQAQQGLAEDFSSDPFSLNVRSDNLGSAADGWSLGADGTSLNMRATTISDDRAKIYFQPGLNGSTNELSITASLSGDSEFSENVYGEVKYSVYGYFYNDTQENGLGDDERTGDTRLELGMYVQDTGAKGVYACLERRNNDGSRSALSGANFTNGDRCFNMASVPELDKQHTLTIGYDKEANNVYFVFDTERAEHEITTQHFTAQNQFTESEFRVNGISTVGLGSLHSVRTNNFNLSDLSAYVGEKKYRTPNSDEDISVVDGKLRLAIESDGSSESETLRAFRALGETKYVEAKLMLSSDSTLAGTGYNIFRLKNYFYNDTANGGTGDDGMGTQTGDVFSSVNLFRKETGEVGADVTVVRADSGDYSSSTLLSNDPDVLFPVLKEGLAINTEYTASIEFDEVARKLIFKLDDAKHIYDIQTSTYTASFVDGAGVDARIRGEGKTIGFADDFRTNPAAKTNEELAAEGGQATGGGTGTGDTGGGAGSGDTTASSDSGGGGCSVGANGSSTGFMFLMALLVSFIRLRKRVTAVRT